MTETCDRCGPGTRAEYRADKDSGTLTFCGHCAMLRWAALASQGFLLATLQAAAPQLSPPAPRLYWVDEIAS